MLLYLAVLPGSQHHPTYQQCFCYGCILAGVRDEKKLATHDIQDVVELFSLVDKCARAAEGYACHMPPAPEARKVGEPDADAAAQGNGNKNKTGRRRRPTSATSRWPALPLPLLLL
jgi:hypothetical protein